MGDDSITIHFGGANSGRYQAPMLWVDLCLGIDSEDERGKRRSHWTDPLPAMVDTGADVTVVPGSLVASLEQRCGRALDLDRLVENRPRGLMTVGGIVSYFEFHAKLKVQTAAPLCEGRADPASRLFAPDRIIVPDARRSDGHPPPDRDFALLGMDVINKLGAFHYQAKPQRLAAFTPIESSGQKGRVILRADDFGRS